MLWLLVLLIVFKVLSDTYGEKFCPAPYKVKANDSSEKIPLTKEEFNKYYFGYPRPTYEVPLKSVAHPLQFFYKQESPVTYGGYYAGMEFPKYWDKLYQGDKNDQKYEVPDMKL